MITHIKNMDGCLWCFIYMNKRMERAGKNGKEEAWLMKTKQYSVAVKTTDSTEHREPM